MAFGDGEDCYSNKGIDSFSDKGKGYIDDSFKLIGFCLEFY